MRDQLENMEAAAESKLDDMMQEDGRLKCGCGRFFTLDEGETVSSHPYAIPVCSQCFQDWLEQETKLQDNLKRLKGLV